MTSPENPIGILATIANFFGRLTIIINPPLTTHPIHFFSSRSAPLTVIRNIDTDKVEFSEHTTIIPGFRHIPLTIRFNIPDPIHPFFGRNEILQQLQNFFHSSHHQSNTDSPPSVRSRMKVVVGPVGSGKTAIARQFIDLTSNSFDNIIWINADTGASLSNSFLSLARSHHLQLSTQHEDGQGKSRDEIVQEIFTKICQSGDSLFIFDNAKSPNKNLKFSSNSFSTDNSILNYLPTSIAKDSTTPAILITSRDDSWGSSIDTLPLCSLNDDEAVNLLLNKLDIDKSSRNGSGKICALKLVDLLNRNPRQIKQAAAYMKCHENISRRSQLSMNDYIDMFNYGMIQSKKNGSSNQEIFTSWQMTVNLVRNMDDKMAGEIIDIFTELKTDYFPKEILYFLFPSKSRIEVDAGMNCLKQFDMLREESVNGLQCLYLLTLFQNIVVPKGFGNPQKSSERIDKIVEGLTSFLTTIEEPSSEYQSIILHSLAEILINAHPVTQSHLGLLEWRVRLAEKLMDIDIDNKSSNLVLELFEQNYQVMKMNCGSLHPFTFTMQNNIAKSLMQQKRFDDSYRIYQEMYKVQLDVMPNPENHPETISTLKSMVDLFFESGRKEEALEILKNVYQTQKKAFLLSRKNEELKGLLETGKSIGGLLALERKIDEALEMYEEVHELEMQFKLISDLPLEDVINDEANQPTILLAMRGMARRLMEEEKYEETLSFLERIHKFQTNYYGLEHPKVLSTLSNMAALLMMMGDWEQSSILHRGVYKIQMAVLGENHEDTIRTAGNVANLFLKEGQPEEALAMNLKIHATLVEKVGSEDLTTLMALFNAALACCVLGRHEKALEMYQQVYEGRKRILRENHLDCLVTKWNMVADWIELENFEKAMVTLEEVAKGYESVCGREHWRTLEALERIVEVKEMMEGRTNGGNSMEV